MSSYLPFGKRLEATEADIEAESLKFKQYEYYGIPYGYFDLIEGTESLTEKDKQRNEARLLILEGKSIPPELGDKLLEYKEQDEYGKTTM